MSHSCASRARRRRGTRRARGPAVKMRKRKPKKVKPLTEREKKTISRLLLRARLAKSQK